MFEFVTGIIFESFLLLGRMAPYLLLGIAVAGLLHVVMPMGTVGRLLGGRGAGSALRAAAIGVPLPLCSCGVVPVAASLKKSGASNGAVVSFLVTTPTSGVDSILATYSLLGGAIAAARVVASFLIGLVAGVVTNLVRQASIDESKPGERLAPTAGNTNGRNPVLRALAYSLDELMGGIARPLLWGTLLGGAIAYLLPPGVLGLYVGQGFISYLGMLAVGIPLYVCASGSIPLAAALLAKGISPGAALIFLIAGPATNAAAVTIISQMLGRRALVIYLSLLITGSLAAGWVTDTLFARFPFLLPELARGASHQQGGLSLLEIVSGVLLGLLVLYHVFRPAVSRFRSKGESTMAMTRLRVADMNCQHCVRTITGAVCELPGVKGVEADPATKLVNLDLEENADLDAIRQAIVQAGFHPEPVEP